MHALGTELAGLRYGVDAFIKVLANYNPFMNAPKHVQHRYLFSDKIEIAPMKAACKKFKLPLQPTIFAIVSQAVCEYNKRRGIKEEKMQIGSAFNMYPQATCKEEIRSGVNIVSV